MNQQAYQEITKMLNAFPQATADIRGLLLTYDEALTGLDDGAICATAAKFVRGEVPGQNKTFAPSVAEFRDEVRRTPIPGRQYLPRRETDRQVGAGEQARMRLKVPMFNYAFPNETLMAELAQANAAGMDAMVLLATKWGIPIPDQLNDQTNADWQRARNQALADIERNPPPCQRRMPRRYEDAA